METLLMQRGREMRALLLICLCLYVLLSMVTYAAAPVVPPGVSAQIPRVGLQNAGGSFGYLIASGFLFLFGMAAYKVIISPVLLKGEVNQLLVTIGEFDTACNGQNDPSVCRQDHLFPSKGWRFFLFPY